MAKTKKKSLPTICTFCGKPATPVTWDQDIYAGLGNLPDGTLVAVNYANSTFVRIDSTTGVATPIGPTGITVAVSASLLTGEQFAIDDQNQLFQIDPATGAARL